MKRLDSIGKSLVGPVILIAVLVAGWMFREQLFPHSDTAETASEDVSVESAMKQTVLEISQQARKNLSLVSEAARPQSYWRTVAIPGAVADRPGLSDRGVTSPAVGVVTAVHAFPGDTMRPGEALFTLRLFSEYLQSTQTQLFKAKQETEIVQAEIDRLSGAVTSGAVSRSKMINLRSELGRQNTLIQAARQELLSRGLTPAQVKQIESGTFVSTVDVVAPPVRDPATITVRSPPVTVQQVGFGSDDDGYSGFAYELQELSVELGQQVQAGQLLAKLANHRLLYVIGYAFKREAALLEQAAQEKRPIEVEFAGDDASRWPGMEQTFRIRHLSNSIDTDSRTFNFFVPLTNQSRSYDESGRTFMVWRFRPGQRVRIHVPVEKYENVFVLPSEAVVKEGPEAFVFRQDGDLFKQFPVHVLHEDRRFVVLENDGSISPGAYLAQGSAASLNRVLKSQSASGMQPGMHVHADGTVHAAH